MSQIKCTHCGLLNAAPAAYCSRCERPLSAPTQLTSETVVAPSRFKRAAATTLPEYTPEKTVVSPPPVSTTSVTVMQERPTPEVTPTSETVIGRPPSRSNTSTGPIRSMPPRASQTLGTSPMPAALEKLGVRRSQDPIALPDFAPVPHHDGPTVVRRAPVPPEARPESEDDLPQHRLARPIPVRLDDSEHTTIPATIAPYGRLLAAMALDSLLIAAVAGITLLAEVSLFSGRWPENNGSLLEALALWMHQYPGTCGRAAMTGLTFAVGYSAWGSRRGRTLGRRILGLITLHSSGAGVTWLRALIRSIFGVISLGCFGAGFLWLIVDGRKRSWHDVVCSTVTVLRR